MDDVTHAAPRSPKSTAAAAGEPGDTAAIRPFLDMFGADDAMQSVLDAIRTAAGSDIAVLIHGPTGSGKEVAARLVHQMSRRRDGQFQAVNCAALPESLFESELFGYEKGAFTGAEARKPGRLEMADGGTLFLDEVGDLSPVAQAKLLRVLEERKVDRLGGHHAIPVDFRLVSATNQPLEAFVREGRFREDLYYRINAFSIRLPPLRERAADIPTLAGRLLTRHCAAHGLPPDAKRFSRDAIDRLTTYTWPGNIRELEATVLRAALTVPGRTIRAADIDFLHPYPAAVSDTPRATLSTLRDAERTHIGRVLDAVGWNKREAARILDISRGTLYRKIEEYGLRPGPGVRARRSAVP